MSRHVNTRHRQSQRSTIYPYEWPGGSQHGIFMSKPIFVKITNGPNPPMLKKPLFTGRIT